MAKRGFEKQSTHSKKEDRKNIYYEQMIKDLPLNRKLDLGHEVFRMAGEANAIICLDSFVSEVFSSTLIQFKDQNGRILIPRKAALITNAGTIHGYKKKSFDVNLVIGDKMGTFVMSSDQLVSLAFSECVFLLSRVIVKERYFRGGQWVIPIDVIGCYSTMQDTRKAVPHDQTIFTFGGSPKYQYSLIPKR